MVLIFRLLCRLHSSYCTRVCVSLTDVEIKLTPLSSTKFAAGRPSEQAHAVGNFIKTSIVESGALLLEDLSLEPGIHAWKLCIDIVCLSFDGNVADAGLVAAMAALMRLKLPATRQIGDELFITKDAPTPLKIHHVPVPLTCGVFDGIIVTDPSLLEEDLITTHVTVVSTATGQVCGVHKPGGSCTSGQQLNTCLQLCQQHAELLVKTLHAAAEVHKGEGKCNT